MSVGVKVPSEATAKVAGSAVLFHIFVLQTILLVTEVVAFGFRPLQKRVKTTVPGSVLPIRAGLGEAAQLGPAGEVSIVPVSVTVIVCPWCLNVIVLLNRFVWRADSRDWPLPLAPTRVAWPVNVPRTARQSTRPASTAAAVKIRVCLKSRIENLTF
jgi:hypothetical protein